MIHRHSIALFFSCLLCTSVSLWSQEKEDFRKHGVQSQTTLEYFIEEGLKKPVVEQVLRFDRNGNVVEEKEFNKLGEIKKWEITEYDSTGNIVSFSVLDEKGDLVEREEYRYSDGLVTEKLYFDSKNRLYKRKVYEYEYREEDR